MLEYEPDHNELFPMGNHCSDFEQVFCCGKIPESQISFCFNLQSESEVLLLFINFLWISAFSLAV